MLIPEVRVELLQIADELDAAGYIGFGERLRALELQLYRRKRSLKTGPKSVPMTDAVRDEIKKLRADYPDWPHQKIADTVGVNPARVSETLSGKRT